MAKRLLLFTLILSFSVSIQAQDLSIKWGGLTKTDNVANNSFEPLGWPNEKAFYILGTQFHPMGIYALYGLNYSLNLEKISKTGRGMSSKELEFNHKRNAFVHGVLRGNYIYVLGSKTKKRRYSLFYEVYDLNGEHKQSREFDSYSMTLVDYSIASERFISSPNDSLHSYLLVPKKRKKSPPGLQFTLQNFNFKFSNHKRTDVSLEEEFEEFTLEDHKIDNQGNTALLFKQTKTKDEEADLFFYLVNAEGKLIQQSKLALDGYYFAKPKLIVSKANQYKLAAFYYALNKKKKVYQGFLMSDLDPQSGKLENLSTRNFDQELLEYYGVKKKKKTAKFTGDFNLEYVLRDDENGHLLAEREYSVVSDNNVTYYQKEVIATAFDSENNLGKISLVPKSQASKYKNINFMGYHAFYWKDKLYLTYNDNGTNLDKEKDKKTKNLKGPNDGASATFLSSIDQEGNVNREIWFESSEEDGYLVPEKCYTDGEIKFIAIASGTKTKFGMIQEAKKKSRTKRKRKKK